MRGKGVGEEGTESTYRHQSEIPLDALDSRSGVLTLPPQPMSAKFLIDADRQEVLPIDVPGLRLPATLKSMRRGPRSAPQNRLVVAQFFPVRDSYAD